jgi:hypothetical protein
MKKLISLIMVMCMIFALAACGSSSSTTASTEAPTEAATEAPAEDTTTEAPAEAAEGQYTLGMGVVSNFDSSETGKAQIDSTVAAVVLDSEGKIVMARLDVAQNKMDVTDGNVTTGNEYLTKMEKGDSYGMVAYGNAVAEWYAQAEAFEAYVVGKTADEVAGIETTTNDEGYAVAADEALYAGCTMQITDFVQAVAKACNDEWAVSFNATEGEFTLGLAAKTTDEDSTVPTAEEDGVVKMYTEFGAAVVSGEGKILAALNDAIQPNITVNTDGEIVDTQYKGTKRELGDDYNMVAYSNAIAEWDAQSAAFSNYVVGMTADQVEGIETEVNDEGYNVAVDEALSASCTISISGMQAVIAQAAEYAR